MKNTAQEIKEMQNKAALSMEMFADLIGREDETKINQFGVVPGIGMETEAEQLYQNSDNVRQGIFNLLFTGIFNGGKSTLINAILGKDLLQTASVPETACIAKIQFGRSKEQATVHYNDGKDDRVMTVEEYKAEMRLKDDAFDDTIDYVQVEQEENKFENLIQFVDSLGFDSNAKESEMTLKYEPQANAVVFLVNAHEAMTETELDRFRGKYYYKQMKNLFVVVTHMDQIPKQDVPDMKERIRKCVEFAFTDASGKVDEKLYENRVFFVDSYGAFLAKTGQKREDYGGNEYTVDINKTGVPELEEALTEFLLSDDKYKEMYALYGEHMKGYFKDFKNKAKERIENIRLGADKLRSEKTKKEEQIENISEILKGLENRIGNFIEEVKAVTDGEYLAFCTSVRADWDEYFEEKASTVDFRVGDNMKVMWASVKGKFKDEEETKKEIEELIKPITDEIAKEVEEKNPLTGEIKKVLTEDCYMGIKMKEFKQSLGQKMAQRAEQFAKDVQILVENLEAQTEDMGFDIEAVLKDMALDMGGTVKYENKGSIAQAIISIVLCGDWDTAFGAMNQKMGVGELIKTLVVTTLTEAIIASIITALTGIGMIYVIGRIAVMIFRVKGATNEVVLRMFHDSKEEVCNQLDEERVGVGIRISQELDMQVNRGVSHLKRMILGKLNDEQKSLEHLIQELETENINANEEEERMSKLSACLLREYNLLSECIDGKSYTEEELLESAL